MNIETVHDLFVAELRRAYAIETRLTDALATMADDTDADALDNTQQRDVHETLRAALTEHVEQTETHRDRLESAFAALDQSVEMRETPALDGLVEEKEQFNNVVLADDIRPLFYIETAKEIEQLEVYGYDRLLRFARHLDVPDEVRDALEQNREEDQATLDEFEAIATGEAVDSLIETLTETHESG